MGHRFEGIPTARAIGDYLRDFEDPHLDKMNEYP
jgi:hypothetical protein